MLQYTEVTYSNIPTLLATAVGMFVLTVACFTNPATGWLRRAISKIGKESSDESKRLQLEIASGVTREATEKAMKIGHGLNQSR